jgi:diguanylate cyclase (GGDEF)-like protein
MPEAATRSDASPLYPNPRRAPWAGFALAAEAAVQHLNERVDLDLWMVTHVVGDEQIVVASAGHWAALAQPGTAFSWPESFCRPMTEQRGPTVAPDVLTFPEYAGLATGVLARVRAYVGVPLEGREGRLFGTLCAFAGEPRDHTLGDILDQVQLVGQMLSTILASEELAALRSADAASAHALAERDSLTGLRNRRGWLSTLSRENDRARRYGASASIIVVDLEDMKGTNEAAGLSVGDDLLRRCADVLRSLGRPGDVPARPGGNEFCLLAVECDAACARALLARLRVNLRTAGVNASAGVATRRLGEDLSETCRRANEAMYREKRLRQPGQHG